MSLNHPALAVITLGSLITAATTSAAPVILNEYNAVGSTKHLEEDDFVGSTKADSRLGRIEGNGGNWFELAVVGDGSLGSTVNLRGWSLDWTEGSDAGSLNLSADAFWSNVTAGTLITIGELQTITAQDGSTAVNGSDTAVDFSTGDNWAHVWSFDTSLITSTTTNVAGDGSGNFSVGNSDWQLTLRDAASNVVFGPEGEGISDGGVNSNEVYKLEADVSTAITAGSAPYSDGTSSSFGGANIWSGGDEIQDFTQFGVVPEPTTAALIGLGVLATLGRRRRQA